MDTQTPGGLGKSDGRPFIDLDGDSDSYNMLVDPLGDNDEDILFDDDRVTIKQYDDDGGDSSSDNDHYGNEGGGWLEYSEDDDDDDDIDGFNNLTADQEDDNLFGADRHKRATKKNKRKKNGDDDEINNDDNSSSNDNRIDHDEDMDDEDDDDDDTMTRAGLSRLRRNFGLPMLDLFGGMMTGLAGQFRNILENLSNHDDQTQQLIALQELAETLSISTEEDLAGFFQCDLFMCELVKIMKGAGADTSPHGTDEDTMLAFALNEQYGGGNPELMLLACRCISNLLDVLPSSASYVVGHGAVAILCDKLKAIEYIDLAEQALGVRTKKKKKKTCTYSLSATSLSSLGSRKSGGSSSYCCHPIWWSKRLPYVL
jgi:E3 ubiquitin-protein ligase TRIP12